jgi:aldose 1-epimerase
MDTKITIKSWGCHQDKKVYLFKIKNATGAYVELTNYGAGIVSVVVPDHRGKLGHVVLGFDHLQAYLDDKCYIGSTIGRFANRISNASFRLKDNRYNLESNELLNSNHSGSSGYHAKVFDFTVNEDSIIFSLFSEDGDGGYPGSLKLNVIYQWTENNLLKIDYKAICDKDTVANFTNHAYFNLSGEKENILNHRLTLFSEKVLETTSEHLPTGKIIETGKRSLANDRIADKIQGTAGFNDYYILNKAQKPHSGKSKLAAVLNHWKTGRILNVYTSYPGLMFYTGDYLQSGPGRKTSAYGPFDGLCLECQFYPDAPNHASFPSTVLKAGERYDQQIVYEFTLAEQYFKKPI